MSDSEVSKEAEKPAIVDADSSTQQADAKTDNDSNSAEEKGQNGATVEQQSSEQATPSTTTAGASASANTSASASSNDDKPLSSLEEKIVRQIEVYFNIVLRSHVYDMYVELESS